MGARLITNRAARGNIIFLCAALLFLPLSFARAQVPFGGVVTNGFPGECTASAPTAIPFYITGFPPPGGPYMFIPGVSVAFLFGPPTHSGQAILGLAAGFYPCLYWSVCGITPCPLPFPAHPGGLLVVMSGTSK